MSQFQGFKVQVELKDGKLITGSISKCNSKSLTLQEVVFSDGGISQLFKVKSTRLKNLKVIGVPKGGKKWISSSNTGNSSNGSHNNNNNNNGRIENASRVQNNGAIHGSNGSTSNTCGTTDISDNNGSVSRSAKVSSSNNSVKKDGNWEHDDDLEKLKSEEFDFQGNLRMFNKEDVFAKLKQQDTVNPNERLVSHNKQKKTKLNFENDEMVITNAKDDDWEERPGVSATKNRTTTPSVTADAGSSGPSTEYLPITKSINITHLLQQSNKSSASEEEVLSKLQKVLSPSSRSPSLSKTPGFRTLKTNISVPLANPVQLLEMERLASDTFAFPPALSIEHSAVHLSKFIKQKLGGRARLYNANNNAQPLMVILASDNRSGARALAVGRCLSQHGHIRVIAVLTTEMMAHGPVSDNSVRSQLEMFTKFGGKIVDTVSGLKSMLEKLNSPVEIVLDAMQGFDCNLSDLVDTYESDDESSELARIKNLITWCNEQTCAVWSLDIPSGIDAGSAIPNFDTYIRPTTIISTAWPLTSLNLLDCHELYLCDIGIPQQCYAMRNSLRKFSAVEDIFVTEGVVQLTR
ncbi:Edc3p Ecym_1354 [Eremothecium cymbalariae DBVPG|uniref:Enhancer of mRNA-decapping protein 3 n=1 Tax=Eremothecium cymbalariae (strain CBS 270.75 / DBVPG 7215 / KCTC 17166 / NRRL Y-17582) TaxID=931890 RepID=G8JNC3_ERECY|nr:hypothetical protein Ecym_1354 [Eremothecium cymbalariae DBVPG\